MGHAQADETSALTDLRRKAAETTLSIEELLRLALLEFEPAHDAFASIEVLKQVLVRDQGCDLARVWLAYLMVFELMDESALREAIQLASGVSPRDQRLNAAALWVKGAAFRALNDVERSIIALEESVRLEPEWVANRTALAAAYTADNRKGESIQQLMSALANVEHAGDFSQNDLFELLLTGRARTALSAQLIHEQIRRVERKT